jgi:1,4-dihydroxy-2-naphthoate octaprenyltransferase
MTTVDAVQPRPRAGLRHTFSAYARLSNLKVYFQYVAALVAWSLVPEPFGLPAQSLLALVLFVLGVVSTACSAGTLDDVQGYRDGLDAYTYANDDALRGKPGKPLLTGEISERSAHRFAMVLGALGLALGCAAILVAPHHPLWLIGLWVVAWYAATQYSYGIKLSYHGAGELLLAVEAVAVLMIPLVFLTGRVTDTACFEAYLLGTLFAQVTIFSSSQDADIDRRFDRMTIAARLSPRANRRFIASVFVTGWTVVAAGFVSGALEPALLVALLPTFVLQGRQLVNGLGRRQWLLARYLGWRAFDAGVVAMILVNLVLG